MAHKYPAQLEALIKSLQHADFDFYIHVDGKVKTTPFKYLSQLKQVYFIKDRVVCNWGGYSLVKSMITSIDQILDSEIKYDFINLLSAQDFPIKSVNYIHDFFSKKIGYSFISFDKSNDTLWWKEAENRYKKYHLSDVNFKGKFALQKTLNFIAPDRVFLNSFNKLYGGNRSTWWTIDFDCAAYLSYYFKANPELERNLKYTWGSDEIIIVTILMQSPYKNKIINENYRYIVFSDNEAHPDCLTMKDYEKLINSNMLFARKFDTNIDENILNNLKDYISVG